MIPIIVAQVVQQVLSGNKHVSHGGTHGFTVPTGESQTPGTGVQNGGSIADDVGRLTTDALSLLGLGTSGAAASTSAGTQAYAATGALGQ